MQVVVAPLFLWKLSAAMGLYWLASAAVSAVQAFVLRIERRRGAVRSLP